MVDVAASLRRERRRRHGCFVFVVVVSLAAPRCSSIGGRTDVNEQNIFRPFLDGKEYTATVYYCLLNGTIRAMDYM